MPTTVLYLGATGYIGGSALVALIKEHPDVTFTALVRSDSDVAPVFSTGAMAIKDAITDYEALTERVSKSEIVFNCTSSMDVNLNSAILNGFKKRFDEGKGVGSFIHTSGAGNFVDDTKEGKFDPTTKVWTDSEEDIRQLDGSRIHGKVDVAIMKAASDGYINNFIVCPSGVFGKGNGPVKKCNPYLLQLFVPRGKAFYVGEGSNVIGVHHIDDLVKAYKIIFSMALSTKGISLSGSPYSRYYIVVNETLTWKAISNIYARALFERGKVSKPDAESITLEEGGPYAIGLASNMKIKSVALPALGWEPKKKINEETITEGMDEGLVSLKL